MPQKVGSQRCKCARLRQNTRSTKSAERPLLGWASVWRAAGVTTNPAICPAIETQQPADIMETESVRQLHKHHRRQMAPDGVTPGHGIHPMRSHAAAWTIPCGINWRSCPRHIEMMTWWGANGGDVNLIGLVTPFQPRFPAPPPNFIPSGPSFTTILRDGCDPA